MTILKLHSTWLCLIFYLKYLRSFNLIGGTEKVWASRKLAERVHHGGHSYTAEKGDGSPT